LQAEDSIRDLYMPGFQSCALPICDLYDLTNGSVGLEHHERPDYADKLQVLRTELYRSGWGSMQALLTSIGLAIAVLITGVLLARVRQRVVTDRMRSLCTYELLMES